MSTDFRLGNSRSLREDTTSPVAFPFAGNSFGRSYSNSHSQSQQLGGGYCAPVPLDGGPLGASVGSDADLVDSLTGPGRPDTFGNQRFAAMGSGSQENLFDPNSSGTIWSPATHGIEETALELPAGDIFNLVKFDADCEVTNMDPKVARHYGVVAGSKVLMVNGVSVSSRADIRQMIGQLEDDDPDQLVHLLLQPPKIDALTESQALRSSSVLDATVGGDTFASSVRNASMSEGMPTAPPPEQVLAEAIRKQLAGRCVVVVTHNRDCPEHLLHDVAHEHGAQVTTFDAGISLYQKPSRGECLQQIDRAIQRGEWLNFIHATKSMTLLGLLCDVLRNYELQDRELVVEDFGSPQSESSEIPKLSNGAAPALMQLSTSPPDDDDKGDHMNSLDAEFDARGPGSPSTSGGHGTAGLQPGTSAPLANGGRSGAGGVTASPLIPTRKSSIGGSNANSYSASGSKANSSAPVGKLFMISKPNSGLPPAGTSGTSQQLLQPFPKNSRIFIMMEPHPHFPEQLLRECVMLRYLPREGIPGTGPGILVEVGAHDVHRQERMVRAGKSTDTVNTEAGSRRQSTTMNELTFNDSGMIRDPYRKKKKIGFTSDVSVVEFDEELDRLMAKEAEEKTKAATKNIEEEDIAAAKLAAAIGEPQDVASSIRLLRSESRCYNGEKFTCLSSAGQHRIAAGTNEGNVCIMDYDARPLLTFHAHPACIWGLDFFDNNRFASASEDHNVHEWVHDARHDVHGYQGERVSRFSSDVMAVRYVSDNCIVAGGMNGSLVFHNRDARTKQSIPTISTIQAIGKCPFDSKKFVTAGGSGAVTIFDAYARKKTDLYSVHTLQVSQVAWSADNVIASGSFDGTIAIIDTRVKDLIARYASLNGPTTALALEGNELIVCSSDTLAIYDVRRQTSNPSSPRRSDAGEIPKVFSSPPGGESFGARAAGFFADSWDRLFPFTKKPPNLPHYSFTARVAHALRCTGRSTVAQEGESMEGHSSWRSSRPCL